MAQAAPPRGAAVGSRACRAPLLAYLRGRTIVYTLARVQFEWHPPKAEANLRTHGVSFAEAVTVLEDDFALTREDPQAGDIIRLISAWKANKRQRTLYEEGRS